MTTQCSLLLASSRSVGRYKNTYLSCLVLVVMAEWAHYSLPDAELTEFLASNVLPPTLPSNTDMKTRRELVGAFTRKMVEAADKDSCEFL